VSGLQGGDILSIVGRPAAGKTYKMLQIAKHVWWTQKKIPMFVSMEIKPLPLIQRVAAMHSKVSITKLKHASLSTKSWGKLKTDLSELHEYKTPFWIVDGNLTSTVADIMMLCRQLHPDVLFIDGGYLLRHPSWRLSRWEKIAENIEMIKEQIAGEMNIPVVISYQFSRESSGKQDDGTGIEHIAGADVIGQISSIVLGLFEPDSVETLQHRHIEVLKGRSGEIGGFDINWIFDDWPFMDFNQKADESKTELIYI